MDEFAQTRGADDLFDDEIVPVPAEEQPQVIEEPAATQESEVAPPPPVNTPSRPRGGERRGRGRGRGRGGAGRGGSQNASQKRTDTPSRPRSVDTAAQQPESENNAESPQTNTPEVTEQEGKTETASAAQEGPRVPAVRGDRSATGGIKKPKLTEEELSRRIAAAKELAAKKAAAHARAEADQASFMEREKVATEKRRQELQNRRVMDSERERNRQRKLQAYGGREWDADKQESDFSSRGGKQFRRGMHGGVSGYTRRDFEETPAADETPDINISKHASPRERGRGGRGGRGRGGGSRGQQRGETPDHQPASTQPKAAPGIDNESEFPALPGGGPQTEKETTEKTDPDADLLKLESSLSPVSGTGATWADQVEGI